MLNYNSFDCGRISTYIDIMEALGLSEVTDEEVWEQSLNYSEMSVFENILLDLTLSRIKETIQKTHPGVDVSYYVNCADTHLYINGEEIYDIDDYVEIAECFDNELIAV